MNNEHIKWTQVTSDTYVVIGIVKSAIVSSKLDVEVENEERSMASLKEKYERKYQMK